MLTKWVSVCVGSINDETLLDQQYGRYLQIWDELENTYNVKEGKYKTKQELMEASRKNRKVEIACRFWFCSPYQEMWLPVYEFMEQNQTCFLELELASIQEVIIRSDASMPYLAPRGTRHLLWSLTWQLPLDLARIVRAYAEEEHELLCEEFLSLNL